ncbi:MAG: ImmA/IrrE family metallo-endopeptidase [Janthinobacterium lividum]
MALLDPIQDEEEEVRIAPIRGPADHARVVRRIEEIFDAKAGTPEGDELEVLAMLVAHYERSFISVPSPVEAIRFRLQQQGLSNRALEPFLGSRSRVSEILSGERKLTVDMMRALHQHFGIPAESLLGAPKGDVSTSAPRRAAEPSARALSELLATGLMRAQEAYTDFLDRAAATFMAGPGSQPAHLRKTRTDRTNAKTDVAALEGWCAAALLKSAEVKIPKTSVQIRHDMALAREIARLSSRKDGVRKVGKFLAERGIALVVLRHLTGTYLDGAAMRRSDGIFVIALTLRHDRIDNFWFTLLHEFAHVACHLGGETSMILDDLELGSTDAVEAEADCFAQEALIPDAVWKSVHAEFGTAEVAALAAQAGVAPAIVAGRWQREFQDYRRFAKTVGHGEVRKILIPGTVGRST